MSQSNTQTKAKDHGRVNRSLRLRDNMNNYIVFYSWRIPRQNHVSSLVEINYYYNDQLNHMLSGRREWGEVGAHNSW